MASSISIESLLVLSKAHSSPASSFNPIYLLENNYTKFKSGRRKICRAMQGAVQGPSAAYAKEMERLSAKESLLLAFRGAGGFEGLVSGKVTDMQRMDVNERIVNLERLNPSPRPTTRLPSGLAYLSKLDVGIKDTYANVAATLRLLNSIEIKYTVSSRLSVEGAIRMKQEFLEGLLDSSVGPDAGFKLPLLGGGSSERFFMISYLDDEILIIRDTAGAAEVLTRLDPGP